MDKALIALGIGLAVALVFGYYVAQRSNRQQKIQGGAAAQVFHYIGAAGIAGILPVILANLILGQGFRTAFPSAIGFLVVGWVALMLYAIVERPALEKNQALDHGWTKEDASKSY
jgi:hypothetical protein